MTDDGNPGKKKIGKPRGRYCIYLEPGMEHLQVPRQTLFSQRQVKGPNHPNQPAGIREVLVPDNLQQPHRNRNVDLPDVNITSNVSVTHPNDQFNVLHQEEPPDDSVIQDELQQSLASENVESDLEPVISREEEDVAVPAASLCVGVCICGQCNLLDEDFSNEVADVQVANQIKKYKDRHNFNEAIFPGVETTKFETFLLILHMALRHGMTGPLIEDQLRFVNALFGQNVISTSQFIFKRLFMPKSLLEFHFYCSDCNFYLGEKESFDNQQFVICDVCKNECNVYDLHQSTCFVTLHVMDQIEELINKPDIKLVNRSERDMSKISDIIDGSVYQELCKDGAVLTNPNSLSITFNVDGAQVFNTGKGSLWPIQFILNEIDPSQRFRAENVGLVGLWFGRGAPDPSVFMTPFIVEMQKLADEGVQKRLPDGSSVQCPVFAISSCLDNIAQAKFAKRKQFNGRFGCGYCFHPNTPITDSSTSKITRKYTAGVSYPYRSHHEAVSDMYLADLLDKEGRLKRSNVGKITETWDDVRGIKGITPFIELPGFDAVFSFVIDYMHNMMNVMDKIHDVLFSPKSKGKDYHVSASQQRVVNKRLMSISPPHSMFRGTPRSLDDFADWKAIDCRSFILVCMLPCLEGILPRKYFKNLQDLVCGYQILLQESITPAELSQANKHLQKFVEQFNVLYGNEHMTYNIHLCGHLSHMVSLFGPLWCYSAFPFESGNGHLIKLVKGTKFVVSQIAQKYATVQAIPNYVRQFNVSERVIDACRQICSYSRLKNSTELNDGTGLSSEVVCKPSQSEIRAMRAAGMPDSDTLKYFNRVVRNGCVYYSSAYEKPAKFNDTCVSLVNGQYAVIHKLSHSLPGELWAFVNPLRLSENEHLYLAPHIKTCSARLYAPLCLIPFSDIVGKCCLVSIDDRNFVCLLPNRYERN